MNVFKTRQCFGMFAVALALVSSTAPGGAATPPVVAQATAQATLTGAVHDGTGAPVVGAHVTVTGATTQTATPDAAGNFSVTVPAGIYRVAIDKGGYNAVALTDVTAAPGTSTP